jgi:hypothetical protein
MRSTDRQAPRRREVEADPDCLFPWKPGYATPRAGQFVKAELPPCSPDFTTEWVWVIARRLTDDGLLLGQVDNHPVTRGRGFKAGDVVRFALAGATWQPAAASA